MTEQTPQTVVDQGVSTTSNVAPTSTATPTAPTHIQTQQQLQQQQQNQAFMQQFWNRQLTIAEQFESDFKNHPLPLARIKKVMKSDQDVKAPILFSKACEIFISEITMRAWIHAEENKRRTLQRSDVASAVSRSDQFDFLIDIVPREEVPKSSNRRPKEEPQTEHIYGEPNVLAYYQHQPGMPYPPDAAASYYQQLQVDHIQHGLQLQHQLQHQLELQRQLQRQSSTSSDTTSQTVATQQQEQSQTSQQHSTQQSTPQDQKQTSQQIKNSAPPSTTSSDDQQIQALLASANAINTKHQPQESEDQDKQRSKSTRKGSKKTKK